MLTRLRVSGFKNLVDVDVRFGPFTCIAGANAVGKSNLFDAVRFLSLLAERPLVDAALAVRDEGGRLGDIEGIFHRAGDHCADTLSFEAEMIIPASGVDDLGQPAQASITFVRYSVEIARRQGEAAESDGALELLREELTQINKGDAQDLLLFPHRPAWRESAVSGAGRRGSPFISTDTTSGERIIRRHQEGRAGRFLPRRAADLPRTVLSVAQAAESPTALLTRREMQSWRLLQLEPTALRRPDEITAPRHIAADGSHLAATLYRLARTQRGGAVNGDAAAGSEEAVYAAVANRLAELIDDVRLVRVDRDDRRELLSLAVTGRDGTTHPARALSDGTLRFLALAVLQMDPAADRLLCMEEPENGVHPDRIPAILHLLEDISADVNEPVDDDNPLRQVIVNTHSPLLVQSIPDDALLVAENREQLKDGRRLSGVSFACLPETWRAGSPEGTPVVTRGTLLSYLGGFPPGEQNPWLLEPPLRASGRRRIAERRDLQPALEFAGQDA